MSAGITIFCDGEWAEGLCPQSLVLLTVDVDQAERTAAAHGWSVKPGRRHKCPACARAGR